jgi:hypothetical protein
LAVSTADLITLLGRPVDGSDNVFADQINSVALAYDPRETELGVWRVFLGYEGFAAIRVSRFAHPNDGKAVSGP